MKKAKIMLIAITVIAITGGALAFKARTFTSFDLCTAATPGICTTATSQLTADEKLVNPDFYYSVIAHDDAFDLTSCNEIQDRCTIPGENVHVE